ncbi:hypothetical protein V7S43_000451 [Phytophthora oleae]|uniref:Uncharacterized protein n=1 Tax=Phytophthora oleae TaxID=2107226 RepID=A0ABD3G5T7_9STRA
MVARQVEVQPIAGCTAILKRRNSGTAAGTSEPLGHEEQLRRYWWLRPAEEGRSRRIAALSPMLKGRGTKTKPASLESNQKSIGELEESAQPRICQLEHKCQSGATIRANTNR